MPVSMVKYSDTMWKLENTSNNKKALIRERYEPKMTSSGIGRYYVDGPDGREIRPYSATAFDHFSDAKKAAENSIQ